ncbi:DUF1826 domain-containing protein [Chryseobacterium sp.]|uniref:DUF1826 domain-containing protein n=1 Tax=Chryseobacterium sp. TaxID=1871047 RepID=UPI00289F61A7|nr:DUF1826 domain-containing protein [Chryseobacterium sp.]
MPETFLNNPQTEITDNFSDLINKQFEGMVNAVCWQRNLEGDFEEIVSKLQLKQNITEISADELLALPLSEKGNIAKEIILNDLKLLTDFGASPSLNLLKKYERDDEFDFISTDVYSYHVDRSPVLTDTFLCTYYGSSSDIIANNQVVQKILIPEIREKLKSLHSGSDEDFENFLSENFFDLHYQAKPNSIPTNLGTGNLWRLAVDHPQQKVLPCVHRAPVEHEKLRLLIIC